MAWATRRWSGSWSLGLGILMLSSWAPAKDLPSLSRYEFSEPQMGVPFRIVFYAADRAAAEHAAKAVFLRIRALNAIFSDYEYESELSRLSHRSGTGAAVPVSVELWDILARSQALARRSGGAFDITVGPCVNLWRKARRDRRLPEPRLIAEAQQRVGYSFIILDKKHRAVELRRPNMRLDLGGIAKGYAADEGLAVLKRLGITRALVSAAGDVAVGDPPPNQRGWRIEIGDFDPDSRLPAKVLSLRRAAVSTSGDSFQRLEIAGKRYSHILDPFTCVGLTDHSLVTVVARDSTTADSLATTLSVLGPERGLRFVKKYSGVAARIVRRPAQEIQVFETPGFKAFEFR